MDHNSAGRGQVVDCFEGIELVADVFCVPKLVTKSNFFRRVSGIQSKFRSSGIVFGLPSTSIAV